MALSFLTRLLARGQAAIPPAAPPLPAVRFARLRTARGNLLTAGGARIGMAEAPALGDSLVAVLPLDNARLCFLMAPDLRPVALQSDGLRGVAISAFRMPTGEPDRIRLRHPLAPGRHAAVTQPGEGAPDGCVIFDSVGQTAAQLFTLEPLDAASLPDAFIRAAGELCSAVSPGWTAYGLVARLRDGRVRQDFAEALIRVLPRRELAFLAEDLLSDPSTLGVLRGAIPDDPWFARVMPALRAWQGEREAACILRSEASDEFAGDPLEGYGQPQAGFALNGLARGCVRPRRGACLIASARNEGPYVLEWLAYHRAIGFEHVFLYTNNNGDGSDALLEALARGGAITLIHNEPGPHCGPQYKAYAHALSLLPQVLDYAWAAVLDLDEYCAFDASLFADIGEYMSWQDTQPVDAVALCWQVFAGMRDDRWREEPTIARFTRREPQANAHVKSIFRPHPFWHAQAHFPQPVLGMPFVFRNETGGLHHHAGEQARLPAFSAAPSARMAWVNHYLLRSAPEALWKLARGHGDWKGRVAERHREMARFICRSYVSLADKPDLVEDRRILRCGAHRIDGEMAALRSLPGVASAEAEVMQIFASGLETLTGAFISAPVQPGEPPEFEAFRNVLRGQIPRAA